MSISRVTARAVKRRLYGKKGGGAGQAGADLISRGLGAMMKPEFQQLPSLSDASEPECGMRRRLGRIAAKPWLTRS